MKNTIYSIFALVIILSISGCNVVSKEEDLSQVKIEPYFSLNQLLLKAVPSEKKPNRVTLYQLKSFINHKDIYYDSDGAELFNIYLNESLDTTSIVLYDYSGGLLFEKNAYPKDLTGYNLTTTFKYIYNADSSLRQITREGNNYLLYTYSNDGLVSEIISGPNLNAADVYYFFYDEDGKTIRQIWGTSNKDDSPIRDWHYLYDESGKLLSKSIPVSTAADLRPMFVYSYDNQDRIIEELELYPEYDFSLLYKTTYRYSESN